MQTGLQVLREDPFNAETAVSDLVGGVVMPAANFYVRNHFAAPDVDASSWRLEVGGLVDRPLRLSLREIQTLPSQTLQVTLECAGNGRSLLSRPAPGEQWGLGAVSTAEWTGVPLAEVLARAGIRPRASEVVFRGADKGPVDDRAKTVHFERSLSLGVALTSEVLLAYAMNGEPLPAQHGFPLRAIVPGWYGVASVKWLTRVNVVSRRFGGFFQTKRYFFERDGSDGAIAREPVTRQRVRAVITEPAPEDEVAQETLAVRGLAWSGAAPIARVEVSLGGGAWREARLLGEPVRHSWRRWELITRVDCQGAFSIRARATDCHGRTQPEKAEWNRLGYGANAVHEVRVHRNAGPFGPAVRV
jgi:DMSO/TMAO reductase YedYZ molybdopterin-dependent catalytic subunit